MEIRSGALPRTPARATRPLQTRGWEEEEGLRPSNPSKGVNPFANPFSWSVDGDILTLVEVMTF